MDPLKNAEIESRRINKKICTHDDSASEDGENDLQVMSLANNLSEDELTLIFSSYWIFTQDLLNFRLVNKRWRNAATTILRQRDACCITLIAKTRAVENDGDDVAADGIIESCFYKYGDKEETFHTLSQLTVLISNSPKFPASNFRVDTFIKPRSDYTDYPDLALFFKLHGDKIKTFRPQSYVSQQQLLDICFIHSPKLECLDLTEALSPPNNGEGIVLPSKILPYKSIIFGHGGLFSNSSGPETGGYQELIPLLLSSPSKLSSIEVTPMSLAQVLGEGKGDLVRRFDFHHDDGSDNYGYIANVEKYLELTVSPILSKVSLDLSEFNWYQWTLAPINALIMSCRETVQDLTLQYPLGALAERRVRLKIPPMKYLKAITVSVKNWDFCSDSMGRCESYFVFEFEDEIPGHSYFPSLLKVKMEPGGFKFRASMSTFSNFFHNLPENTLPNVDILEINTPMWEEPQDFEFKLTFTIFPKLFPNLRLLKFSCGKIRWLTSSLWTLRSLEFIEIYRISRSQKAIPGISLVPFVDQLFTGFSLDM